MKTKITISILAAILFFVAAPSQSLPIETTAKEDSMAIISHHGTYFVYSKSAKIKVSNGELTIPLIDSLSFIDTSIPRDLWVKAYLKKSLIYKETNEDPIHLEVENWTPKLFVTRHKSKATLIDGKILSETYIYETEATMGDVSSGKLIAFTMLCIGMIMGFVFLTPVQGNPYIGPVILTIFISTVCYFLIGRNLTALLLPSSLFLSGFIMIIGLYRLGKTFKKKKQKSS